MLSFFFQLPHLLLRNICTYIGFFICNIIVDEFRSFIPVFFISYHSLEFNCFSFSTAGPSSVAASTPAPVAPLPFDLAGSLIRFLQSDPPTSLSALERRGFYQFRMAATTSVGMLFRNATVPSILFCSPIYRYLCMQVKCYLRLNNRVLLLQNTLLLAILQNNHDTHCRRFLFRYTE